MGKKGGRMGIGAGVTGTAKDRNLTWRVRTRLDCTHFGGPKSIVERGTQDRSHKVREMGSAFVELKVAHDTMVGEIFCDASFSDAQMIGEAGLDGLRATPAGCTAQKTADGDAQSLARLDIVVRRKVGIAEQEHAGTNRSAIGVAEFQRGAGQEPPELHLQ